MDPTAAALLGSLIGALAALAGSVITNIVALKSERRRQESATQTLYVQALRERSGAAFGQFFKVVHAMEWISWYGDNDPDAINPESIKAYEDEVNNAYGNLLGAIAMAASLSLRAYEELKPILSQLYELEIRVGGAIRRMASDRPAAIEELRECKSEAGRMRDSLPPQLHRIMALAEASTRRSA
jgi:hypothetical protein